MLKKIVVIGPESTGKSTLCEALARTYNSLWCPEYAREYLVKNGKYYKYNDLLTIAKGQLKMEDDYAAKMIDRKVQPPYLFVDTDMYVMKVWCEYVFEKCHTFILDAIATRPYDLYLLCDIDIPWAKDELREYPDLEVRKQLFLMYKDLLVNQPVPWITVSGPLQERIATVKESITQLFS
ncbi:AAA family ATPase [Flavihumibacter petaseus]|uniref:NadR/Ttd14 AAA domain-containing protein n=1 Tax=Flavihumibacter petaseus NBRC 106054 TaxID=1220578 RepID=A0A0E9MWX0_9BACT|nr:ATP-binding protein [Flavihumibacter petaseus]GAO42247.1 hypothetical protein FPE01S_01_12600 [Flavihumibacter petaseus NBRC 106054]